jgi:hypothetical protein
MEAKDTITLSFARGPKLAFLTSPVMSGKRIVRILARIRGDAELESACLSSPAAYVDIPHFRVRNSGSAEIMEESVKREGWLADAQLRGSRGRHPP